MNTAADRPSAAIDAYKIRPYFTPLRVVDVADAMDGIGYFNIGLVSQEIRPLWLGMKFWGVAVTMRCVPANKPMWKLDSTEDIVNAHGIWFGRYGHKGRGINDLVQEGSVVVTDVGGADNVGYWG
ncbi:MAG TPA: RraA family protein, partial [Alphaproteobacteria bacterium]|nr:RraA family protein [Alphaproteobacteria bacterium]